MAKNGNQGAYDLKPVVNYDPAVIPCLASAPGSRFDEADDWRLRPVQPAPQPAKKRRSTTSLKPAVHPATLLRSGGRFLRYEFLTAIFPSRKVKTSHPLTSTREPSARVPVNVHSDTPRLPQTK